MIESEALTRGPLMKEDSGGKGRFRWFSGERRVLVFISSPGDCVAERKHARAIVNGLNNLAAVQRQSLRFEPLLWEDLPPGVADEGDFQHRIDTTLKRLGRDRLGIYVGMMKTRLGTPTPRFASGTVEELEQSLARRKRTGAPQDLLFYFIHADEVPDPDVLAFKETLAARHLQYAEVEAALFAERLTNDLDGIATSWNQWHRVLRRNVRRLRNFSAAIVVAAIVAVLGLDAASRSAILQALERDDLERAGALWSERQFMMPVSRMTMRQAVNIRLVRDFQSANDVASALQAFADWKRKSVLLRESREAIAAELSQRVRAVIEASVVENSALEGLALWREALNANLWSSSDTTAQTLLSDLAAERLLSALARSGIPAQAWKGSLLRTAEAATLERLARRMLASTGSLESWSDRRLRSGIALLANSPEALGNLAARALRDFDSYAYPEMSAFVATAEPVSVASWLRSELRSDLSTATVARIAEAVRARRAVSPLMTFVDMVSTTYPEDAAALLDGVSCAFEACRSAATQRLMAWSHGETLTPAALDVLWPALDESLLNPQQRSLLSRSILALPESRHDLDGPVLAALSRLDTSTGAALFEELTQMHIGGRIAFGFSQRAILIDHLSRAGSPSIRLSAGRQLTQLTEEDFASGADMPYTAGGFTVFPSYPTRVDRAYLDLLAVSADTATAEDKLLLRRIIERLPDAINAGNAGPWEISLGRALAAIPPSWLDAMINFPTPPLIDFPWSSEWQSRRVMLRALGSLSNASFNELAESLIRALPDDNALREEFTRAAASIAPDYVRQLGRAQLERGSDQGLKLLALVDDGPEIARYLRSMPTKAATPREAVVLEAVSQLSRDQRPIAIDALVEKFPSSVGAVLSLAAGAGATADILEQSAASALANPDTHMAGAVQYLALNNPELLWEKATAQPMTQWLADADPFTWLGITQAFSIPDSISCQIVSKTLVTDRLVLVELSNGAADSRNADAGFMATRDPRMVFSPLLALLVSEAESGAALCALTAISQTATVAESVGEIVDLSTIADAYLTWLASALLRSSPVSCKPERWLGVEQLDDANPIIARAAAALILAQPAIYAVPHCP